MKMTQLLRRTAGPGRDDMSYGMSSPGRPSGSRPAHPPKNELEYKENKYPGSVVQIANGVFMSKDLIDFMQKAKAIGFDVSSRQALSALLALRADSSLKGIVDGDLTDAEYQAALNYTISSVGKGKSTTPDRPQQPSEMQQFSAQPSPNLVQVLKYAVNMGLPAESKDQALSAIVEFLGLGQADLYDSSVYNELLRIPTDQYRSIVYPAITGASSSRSGNYIDTDYLKMYMKVMSDVGFDIGTKSKLAELAQFNTDTKLIKNANLVSDTEYATLFDDVAYTAPHRMASSYTAAYSMQHITQLLDVLRDMGFSIENQDTAAQVLTLLKSGGGYAVGLADHALKVINGSDDQQYQDLMPSDVSKIYEEEQKNPVQKIEAPPPVQPVPDDELSPEEEAVEEMSVGEKIHRTRQKKDEKEEAERLQRLEKHKEFVDAKNKSAIDTMLKNRAMPPQDQLTRAQQYGAKPPPRVAPEKKPYTPPPDDYVRQVLGEPPAAKPAPAPAKPAPLEEQKLIDPKTNPASMGRNKKPLMTEFASQYEEVSGELRKMNSEARVVGWNESLKLPIWNESGAGPDIARGGMFVFNKDSNQEGMIAGAVDRNLVVLTLPSGEVGMWDVDSEKIMKSKDQIRSREASVKMATLARSASVQNMTNLVGLPAQIATKLATNDNKFDFSIARVYKAIHDPLNLFPLTEKKINRYADSHSTDLNLTPDKKGTPEYQKAYDNLVAQLTKMQDEFIADADGFKNSSIYKALYAARKDVNLNKELSDPKSRIYEDNSLIMDDTGDRIGSSVRHIVNRINFSLGKLDLQPISVMGAHVDQAKALQNYSGYQGDLYTNSFNPEKRAEILEEAAAMISNENSDYYGMDPVSFLESYSIFETICERHMPVRPSDMEGSSLARSILALRMSGQQDFDVSKLASSVAKYIEYNSGTIGKIDHDTLTQVVFDVLNNANPPDDDDDARPVSAFYENYKPRWGLPGAKTSIEFTDGSKWVSSGDEPNSVANMLAGEAMGHCGIPIGAMYTLLDPTGKPVVSVDVYNNMLHQVRGKNNEMSDPAYDGYVKAFMNEHGITTVIDDSAIVPGIDYSDMDIVDENHSNFRRDLGSDMSSVQDLAIVNGIDQLSDQMDRLRGSASALYGSHGSMLNTDAYSQQDHVHILNTAKSIMSKYEGIFSTGDKTHDALVENYMANNNIDRRKFDDGYAYAKGLYNSIIKYKPGGILPAYEDETDGMTTVGPSADELEQKFDNEYSRRGFKMAMFVVAQQMPTNQQIDIGTTINDPNNPQSTGTVNEVKQDGTVVYTDNSGQKVTTQPNAEIEIVKKPNEISQPGVNTTTQNSMQGVGGPNMLS